jgi:hypothetical protein
MSKVRYILKWNRSYFYGGRVPRTIEEIVSQVARVGMPSKGKLSRHQQLVEAFKRFPQEGYGNYLMVFREPKGVSRGRSKYILKLKELGLFKEKKTNKPPPPPRRPRNPVVRTFVRRPNAAP